MAALRGWPTEDAKKAAEAVFLVTPKLAHLFEPGGAFLKDAMTRIYGKDLMAEVFSMVAIVDKIPGQWMIEEQRINDCEGISVMLKPRAPSPSEKDSYHEIGTMSVADSTPPRAFLEFRSALGPLAHDDSQNTEIIYRVALANTLFINGRNATMFDTKWKKSFEDLNPEQSRYLSTYHFHLPHQPMDMEVSSIPLVSLTEPRIVITAMGNIISKIQVGEKVVPASTELEAAVVGSAKSMAKEAALESRTRIYAFVSGTDVREDPKAKFSTFHPFTQFLRNLKFGAGLYQVIGGGGGWGHKRGLLALEPANPFINTAQSASAFGIDGDSSIKAPNTETSPAKEGHSVRFYQLQHNLIKSSNLASVDNSPSPQGTDNVSLYLITRGTAWGCAALTSPERNYQHIMVGTIPTQDMEVVLPATGQGTTGPSRLIELWGVFGALSETGIQMEIHKYPFQREFDEYALLEHPSVPKPSMGTATAESIVRIISVPHTYLAFRDLGN